MERKLRVDKAERAAKREGLDQARLPGRGADSPRIAIVPLLLYTILGSTSPDFSFQIRSSTTLYSIVIFKLEVSSVLQPDMASQADEYLWQKPSSCPPKRGAFIVIEGLDRSGKSTQVKRLANRLYAEGHNIKTLRFPGMVFSCPDLATCY